MATLRSRLSNSLSRRPASPLASTAMVVGVITLLALVVRLYALGTRVAHQDEARVAYWAYRYMESGVYWYRPIVHGPFLTIVDSHVFSLFGASDFTMRLIVALVGGLLPASALLLSDRFRDSETIALAAVLAANPLVLYYSRFYRNDVLLAGFMFVAFAFFVRTYDRKRPVFLYAGVAAFALAFTTKENALVYVVTWLGAAFLLYDRRLLIERAGDQGLPRAVYAHARRAAGRLRPWIPHLALAIVEFVVIVVFFYAPRGEGAGAEPTLGATIDDPTLLPDLLTEALVGSWKAFTGQWGAGNQESYISAVESLWPVLQEGAIVVVVFAIAGFLVDRYTDDRPRDVVSFTFFWGLASAIGYPIIVDNPFPWEVVHVVVPLVVPAAVGLALVGRLGLAGLGDGDRIAAAVAALILVVAAAQVGVTAYQTSFENPQGEDNALVQYAQSSSEMKPLLGEIKRTAQANDGTDVLFYGNDEDFDGDELYAPNPASHDTPTAGSGWFERLPFAWYLQAYDATTDSTNEPETVESIVTGEDSPPVVIAFGESTTCSEEYDSAADIDSSMTDYTAHQVDRFLYDSGCILSSVTVYVANDSTS